MDNDVKIVFLLTGGVLLYIYLDKQGFFNKKTSPTPSPTPFINNGVGHPAPCSFYEEDLGTPEGTKCVPRTYFDGNKQFIVNKDFSVDVMDNSTGESTRVEFKNGDIIKGAYVTYYKYDNSTRNIDKVVDIITNPRGDLSTTYDRGNSTIPIGQTIINIPKDAVSEIGGVRPAFKTGYSE